MVQLANINQEYDITSLQSIPVDHDYIAFYTSNNDNKSNIMQLIISNVLPNSLSSSEISKSVLKNFEILFNQSVSQVLPNCIYSGYETIEFIKPDKTRKDFEDDLNLIGITKEIDSNIKIHRSSDSLYSEINIHRNFSIITIKYGADMNSERLKYLKSNKDKSEQLLWLRERHNVLELNEFNFFNWNKKDIDALSSTGTIPNISFKYIKDPNIEPSILCDPNNLKFSKNTRS